MYDFHSYFYTFIHTFSYFSYFIILFILFMCKEKSTSKKALRYLVKFIFLFSQTQFALKIFDFFIISSLRKSFLRLHSHLRKCGYIHPLFLLTDQRNIQEKKCGMNHKEQSFVVLSSLYRWRKNLFF